MEQTGLSPSDRRAWNRTRWLRGDRRGHYESWFLRANHPTKPLAFWIRYTIFSPAGRPGDALAELWAVAFDGEEHRIVAVKEEHPVADATFSSTELAVRIASSTLGSDRLEGEAASGGSRISWSLRFTSPRPPLLLLDRPLYRTPLPRAKALVSSPLAVFAGSLVVDGQAWPVEDWVGSQNHNWGSQHTTRYAWGQVAGFEGSPDAFLEVGTAQIRLGPIMTPPLTALVLRLGDEELALNTLWRSFRARAGYGYFHWHFETGDGRNEVSGTITGAARDFVGLPYYDPPGGTLTCLNSKIARCDLRVRRPGRPTLTLRTPDRAAFEILTSATDHGVRVLDPHAR
jgi:hypothetical protein